MIRSLPFLPAALLATAAAAQTAPQSVPGLDNFTLPSSQPTPAASPPATPEPTPAVTPAPAPSATRTARPTPRATPRPRASATPRALPTPRVTPSPEPSALPLPPPTATPSATAPAVAPAASSAPAPTTSLGWWPWLAGAALLALAGGWVLLRGRSRPGRDEVAEVVAPETVTPERVVRPSMLTRAPAPLAAPIARAWIELELHPRRGGLNMISATVESEVVLRNAGDAPAEAVVVEVTLLPARTGQDDDLGALFARPLARSAVPAFALAPGEERRVRVVSALPLAAAEPLVAGGRAMLVPVVAVNTFYRWGEVGAGQTAAAFVVGVAREGQAKLAPFWLDAPRMHETLAARPHALVIRR